MPATFTAGIHPWTVDVVTRKQFRPDIGTPEVDSSSGARRVFTEDEQEAAWVKPLKEGFETTPAYEKICSDLANELRLPVPPVLLARSKKPPPLRCASWCDIACTTSPLSYLFPIGEYSAELEDDLRQKNLLTADMAAFDVWIGLEDRDNLGNIVISTDKVGNDRLLYIDHAKSLNYKGRWRNEGFKEVRMGLPVARFELNVVFERREHVFEVAERISGLDDGLINHIAERVSLEGFLENREAELISLGLRYRKGKIRQWMNEKV